MGDESREWAGDQDVMADADERAHVVSVIDSYRRHTLFTTTHVRRQAFYALPQATWQRLAAPPIRFLDTLCAVDDAIADNADIADAIHDLAIPSMGLTLPSDGPPPWAGKATPLDHAKARTTINQFYRDWSAEGAAERAAAFDPVLADLAPLLAADASQPPKVLVPGAGLGRLVFELALRGFAAEGNELSYHPLLASQLVLNHANRPGQWRLHPFACHFANARCRADQLRATPVPDVLPAAALAAAPPGGSMEMAAGDFCALYGPGGDRADEFDAVASVFFVDTAPDLVPYLAAVRHCLRLGGLWANVGPLLWHSEAGNRSGGRNEDADGEDDGGGDGAAASRDHVGSHGSFELALDEVLLLVQQSGFAIEKVDVDGIQTGYISNERSMLQSVYRPVHWVARRLE